MILRTSEDQPDNETTAPLSVVTELAARFSAGDAAGAAALFHPGIRVQQPQTLPHGGWHEGTQGMAEMGARFGEHWTRTIGSPRIFGGPGQGATITQVTTQTWTAKATGRSATVDVVELFQVRDGQVTEIRVFQQDTALLLSTLP